jgi:ribosomal protein S20
VLASESNVRRLTQNEQRELQNRMEKKQMKEFMNVRSLSTASPLAVMHASSLVQD